MSPDTVSFSQGSHRAQTVLITVNIPLLSILTPYSVVLERTDGTVARCVTQTVNVQSVSGVRFKLDTLYNDTFETEQQIITA